MHIIRILFCLMTAVTAYGSPPFRNGHLAIIGGALSPDNADVYREIIQRGGGNDCRVVVIAAASATPVRTGRSYSGDFIRFGVAPEKIDLLPVAVMDDPETTGVDESSWEANRSDPRVISRVDQANIVFLAGGDQKRYARVFFTREDEETPLLQALRRLLSRGGVIAGTSAGAAVMSDPMITGGDSQDSILAPDPTGSGSPVTMDRGPGFWPGGLVDQHFLRRGRWGRLLAALMQSHRHSLGIGIGENTAAFINGNTVLVKGSGAVVVMDTGSVKSPTGSARMISGLVLHYLQEGDRMDLATRRIQAAPHRKSFNFSKDTIPRPQRTPLAGIFDSYALSRLLIEQLAEPGRRAASALCWEDNIKGSAPGIRIVARLTPDSLVFHHSMEGKHSWTFHHVVIDLKPVSVEVRSDEMKN